MVSLGDDVALIVECDIDGLAVLGGGAAPDALVVQLQAGDIILQFNGTRVEDDDHLINLVSLTPVGREVDLVLVRDRQRVRIRARVGNRSELKSVIE